MDGDDNLEQGIRIESCNGVDIGNMEFSGWSGTAIYGIDKPDASLQPAQHTPAAVKIHDNFIHHNHGRHRASIWRRYRTPAATSRSKWLASDHCRDGDHHHADASQRAAILASTSDRQPKCSGAWFV
jgi:hypothetical protein